MLVLARGIEDDHYWVVHEIDGTLEETPCRIEQGSDRYRLSHTDDSFQADLVFGLGAFATAEAAVARLREFL
ncbi:MULTISPECIES: hypothetical protein [unclassified Agreia]|uniref:hypothetical protein n=1 Tax=unclassified Agreia TaxID=2641148 RepID=UPI0006F44A7E|nr:MULTISPECIES: hypothetical protein [unclassified Agreia]KQM59241.1 hypothetical protein ASE64_07525 [Agreia sp. Leaf210]KQO09879.1 hypothetical protein ASF06_06410 [Agreia sp. Leaf244]